MSKARDIMIDVARSMCDRIVAELGVDGVRCVFLSGSVVGDEVSSAVVDGVTELYSDVDLYVVVAEDTPAVRARVRKVVDDASVPEDRYKMMHAPDVGVFTEADLLAQPVRPGMVEAAERRIVLHGSPPELGDRFRPEDIDPREALYLIENRILEIKEAVSDKDDGGKRNAMYVMLKGAVDGITALLICQKEYVCGREARRERFFSPAVREQVVSLLRDGGMDFIRECCDSLQDLSDVFVRYDPAVFAGEVEDFLADLWQRIARRIYGSGDVSGLIEERVAGAGPGANLRELLVVARRSGMNRLRMVFGAAPTARVSSLDLLRVSGLVAVFLRIDANSDRAGLSRTIVPALDRLTRLFGFDEGDLFDRAQLVRKMIAAS
jgi:hypothetical protein